MEITLSPNRQKKRSKSGSVRPDSEPRATAAPDPWGMSASEALRVNYLTREHEDLTPTHAYHQQDSQP